MTPPPPPGRALPSLLLLASLLASGCDRGLPPVVAEVAASEPAVARLVDQYVRRVEADPASARAHGLLGLVYEANGLWEEAERAFAQAQALEPDSVLWRYHRAIALEESGLADEGLALLREAAGDSGSEAAPHHWLGLCLLRDGDVDGALAALQRADRLAPEHPAPKVGLAQVALEKGDVGQAAEILAPIVAEFPQYRHAHYVHGQALARLGREEEARRALALGLDSAAERMPDALSPDRASFAVTFYDRLAEGNRLIETGRAAEAGPRLESLLEERPDSTAVLNNLAVAYIESQQYPRAVETLERLIELEADDFPTYINLSTCYRFMGQLDEALRQADRAVELAPDHARPGFARAKALLSAQRLQEALVELERTVRLDPSHAEAQATLGTVAMQFEDYGRAIPALERAVELSPGHVPSLVNLANALIRTGRVAEAREHVQEAERLMPDHPRVQALRANLDRENP